MLLDAGNAPNQGIKCAIQFTDHLVRYDDIELLVNLVHEVRPIKFDVGVDQIIERMKRAQVEPELGCEQGTQSNGQMFWNGRVRIETSVEFVVIQFRTLPKVATKLPFFAAGNQWGEG